MLRLRTIATLGGSIAIAAVVLNLGFGYIDTIDRIGRGEDVESTNMLDAAKEGIRPGQTSAEAERVLGTKFEPVASDNPGEHCRGYPVEHTSGHIVVCYTGSATDPNGEQRWKVTRVSVSAT